MHKKSICIDLAFRLPFSSLKMDWVKGRKIFTVFTYIVLLLSLATLGFFIYRLIVNVTQDTTVYTVKDRNDSYFLYSKKKAFLNYFFSPGVFKHSKRITNEEEEQPHKIAKKTAYPKKRFIFEKIDPPTLETTSSTSTSTSTSSTSTSTSASTTALTSSASKFLNSFKNRACI